MKWRTINHPLSELELNSAPAKGTLLGSHLQRALLNLRNFPRTEAREEVAMICKGVAGNLELTENFVVIRRSAVLGFIMQHGIKGEKRIPYSAITAVQFKRAGVMNGYIQFTLGGGNENRGGLIAAGEDENSLLFRDNDSFERARDFIEQKIAAHFNPNVGPLQSPVDQLEKLASLLDRGLLTKEEFEDQKRALLKTSTSSPVPLDNAVVSDPPSTEFSPMQAAMDQAIANRSEHAVRGIPDTVLRTFGKRTS